MRGPLSTMLVIIATVFLTGNIWAIHVEHTTKSVFEEIPLNELVEGTNGQLNTERHIDSTLIDLRGLFPEIAMPNIETGHLNMALSSFNVETIENKYVLIDWSTLSTGYSPDQYLIERWTNRMGWVEIQRINGEKINGKEVVFSFLDRNPTPGNSFYRLKHIDVTRNVYSTDIQSVIMYDETKYLFQQDIDENTAMIVSMDKKEKLNKIQVFDMKGNVVNDKIQVEMPQVNKAIIKMHNLETGMYIIKANNFLTKVFKV